MKISYFLVLLPTSRPKLNISSVPVCPVRVLSVTWRTSLIGAFPNYFAGVMESRLNVKYIERNWLNFDNSDGEELSKSC